MSQEQPLEKAKKKTPAPKKGKKAVSIIVPIYGRELVLSSDREAAIQELKRKGAPEEFLREVVLPATNDYLGMAGAVENKETGKCIFFMHIGVPKDPSIVAHEAVHTAFGILDFVGVEVDASNHEAMAYLVTYLVEEYCKAFHITKVDFGYKKKRTTKIDNKNELNVMEFGSWRVMKKKYV